MLQKYDKYLELGRAIEGLSSESMMDEVEVKRLQLGLAQLQQFFVEQILTLPDTDAREQSLLTEINKQLRLLAVDLMFLQGARQKTTFNNRINQTIKRLELIKQYCQAILPIG